MNSILDKAQSEDHAGFRSGFSVEDHLFTTGMLIEGCAEFNVSTAGLHSGLSKTSHTVD